MKYPVYLYIAVMAIVTYLIHAAIDTDQERDQKSFIRSFYIMCLIFSLSVMIFPAIYLRNCFSCFPELLLWQWHCFSLIKGKSLFQVSIAACAIVFILEFSYNIIALTWKICHWQV